MALTPLERKRRSLARRRAEERRAGDPTDAYAEVPFFQYLIDNGQAWKNAESNLAIAGMSLPAFTDDTDVEWDPGIHDEPFRGSIGRAERMVELLKDAVVDLAREINTYKRAALDNAISRIEAADLSEPAAKQSALAEIVRLNRMRDQLDKNVRWEHPQYEVKGV